MLRWRWNNFVSGSIPHEVLWCFRSLHELPLVRAFVPPDIHPDQLGKKLRADDTWLLVSFVEASLELSKRPL